MCFYLIDNFEMNVKIEASWHQQLAEEFEKPYFLDLITFVKKAYQAHSIYPSAKLIFRAFDSCPFDQTRIVILGQDPYHRPGQAQGLCFSVPEGVTIPPSLMNIYKELRNDLDIPIRSSGNLEDWAAQGILLLNATLTVKAHQAGSHQGKGWEEFTDATIRKLSEGKGGLVFLLWGSYALKKGAFIDRNKHLVLSSPHPSPLSAHKGFFGCQHFSKVNEYLSSNNEAPVRW